MVIIIPFFFGKACGERIVRREDDREAMLDKDRIVEYRSSEVEGFWDQSPVVPRWSGVKSFSGGRDTDCYFCGP